MMFAEYAGSDISDEDDGQLCCYCGEKGDLVQCIECTLDGRCLNVMHQWDDDN